MMARETNGGEVRETCQWEHEVRCGGTEPATEAGKVVGARVRAQ
jgi:hypothetical protein